MASYHRRRSHSATSSLTHDYSLENSWRASTKRSHHTLACGSTSPAAKSSWRSKRRRRDASTSDDSLDEQEDVLFSSAGTPKPMFSAINSETQLQPGSLSQSMGQISSNYSPAIGELNLKRLRSDAFWDLRKQVSTQGDMLIRRMRDYERSRSTTERVSRPREGHNHGRKRSSVHNMPIHEPVSILDQVERDSDDDDDDVQIFMFSEDSYRHKKRAASFHSMEIQAEHPRSLSLTGSETTSSPSSAYPSDDEMSSGPVEFTLSTMGAESTDPSRPPSTRAEKALAALSLAMANGGCSINDYEGVFTHQPTADDSQVGELWH